LLFFYITFQILCSFLVKFIDVLNVQAFLSLKRNIFFF